MTTEERARLERMKESGGRWSARLFDQWPEADRLIQAGFVRLDRDKAVLTDAGRQALTGSDSTQDGDPRPGRTKVAGPYQGPFVGKKRGRTYRHSTYRAGRHYVVSE